MWAPSSSLHTTQPLPGLRGRPGSHHPLPARPAARPSSAATTTSDAAAHCNSQLDGERAASCSTSAQPASAAPTRRTVTGAALAALTSLSSAMLQWARPQAAHALRTVSAPRPAARACAPAPAMPLMAACPATLPQVELPDGRSVEVFEHGMSLAIMALRGSVPQQWVMDFKASLGGPTSSEPTCGRGLPLRPRACSRHATQANSARLGPRSHLNPALPRPVPLPLRHCPCPPRQVRRLHAGPVPPARGHLQGEAGR